MEKFRELNIHKRRKPLEVIASVLRPIMCLNGMFGEVACMDSLTDQFFSGWQVNPHLITGAPYIVPITEEQSYMVLQLPKHKQEQPKVKQQELPVFDSVEISPISKQPVQQLLFDF